MGAGMYAWAFAITALLAISAGTAYAQTAPFTAETKSLTTTEVTFTGQVIEGRINLDQWTVTDSGHPAESATLSKTEIRPLNIQGNTITHAATPGTTLAVFNIGNVQSGPFSKFIITHGELSSTSAKPTVKYTPGDLGIGTDGEGGGATPLATHTATATDGVAPAISSAEFDGANVILVTLSEHMKGTAATIEGYTYGVQANSAAVSLAAADTDADPTLPVDYAEQTTTSTLRIELAADASENVAHTVTLPSALLDEADNAFTDSTEDATYTAAPFEAATRSLTMTTITFSGAVAGGSINHNHWSVTDNDGGADRALEVSRVSLQDENGNPSVFAHSPPVNSFALNNYQGVLFLTHAPLSSTGDTPKVTYSGGSLTVGGTAIPDGESVEATDGLAPAIRSAEFAAPNAILVTLSEHMKGTAATIEGYTYAVAAGGSSVGLAAADAQADPSVPIDYAEQAETSTIRITLAASTLPGVAHTVTLPTELVDGADIALTDRTGAATRAGAFEAETQSLTTTRVTFGGGSLGGSYNNAHWSLIDNDGEGEDVALSVSRLDAMDSEGNPSPSGTHASAGIDRFFPSTAGVTYTSLLLTHDPISSRDDTPRVTYTGSGQGFFGEDFAAGGTPVPNDFAEADDGIVPTFTASTSIADRFSTDVKLVFSEPVFLAPGKSLPVSQDWLLTLPTFGGERRLPASSVTWDPAEPTATAGATAVTFRHARQVVPTEVAFSPEATARQGSLVDAGSNALATGLSTASTREADTTAPTMHSARLISSTEIRVTFNEVVRLTSAEFDNTDWTSAGTTFTAARIVGEEVALTVTRASNPTSVAAGAMLAYSGDSVTDAAGNAAAAATLALVDAAQPTVSSARFVDLDTIEATFTEAVASTEAIRGCEAAMEADSELTAADCLATPPPVSSLVVRDTAGNAVASATGTPALSTPTDGATNSVLTFDIAPAGAGLARIPDGDYTLHATQGLSDAHDPPNAYRVSTPGTAITLETSPTFTAMFASERSIVLTASEPLAASTVTDSSFTVSGVGLATTDPVSYTAGSTTVTLALGADAAAGTSYTVTPAATITDTATPANTYAGGAITVTYSPAAAAAVSYTVLDASGTARDAPYEAHARAGDTIRLAIALSGATDPATPPTVLFVGKSAGSEVTMTRVGTTNEWRASYTVETAAQNAGLAEGAFTFSVTATAADGTRGTITQASIPTAVPPTIDRTPPTFTAKTDSDRVVKVRLSEPVTAQLSSTHWSIGGDPVAISPITLTPYTSVPREGATPDPETGIVPSDITFTPESSQNLELRVAQDNPLGSGDTPSVSYTMPVVEGGALILDLAGNPMATQSATATDGVPPAVASYRFGDNSDIFVTFEEDLATDIAIYNQPDLHDHPVTFNNVVLSSSRSVLADTASGCERCVYTVGYTHATSPLVEGTYYIDLIGIADAHGNRHGYDENDNAITGSVARHRVAYDPNAPTAPPTVASAQTSSATLTVVTLSEDVTGATAAADWTVAGTVVRGVASGTQSSVTADADTTDRDTQVTVTSSGTITLLHDAIATDATPSVAYATSTAGRLAGAEGNLGAGSVTATDGAAPTISAATASTTTATITFSEPTSGTTSREDWRADNLGLVSVSETTLDGATTLTLTYVEKGTGATPVILYGGLSLADAASNPVAATSAPHITATDGVAPAFTAAVTNTGRGSIIGVTVTFTEDLSQATGKTLPAAGDWSVASGSREASPTVVVYDLDSDPNTATLTIPQNARLASGGSLVVTLDVPTAGEAARQDSLVDAAGNPVADGASSATADRTAPVMYDASLSSATRVSATFSENVSITFVASDWNLDGSTFVGASVNANEIILEIDPPRSTGLPDNAMLTYGGINSVTDASGNVLAPGSAVAVEDAAAPTVVSATSVDEDTVSVVFSEAIGTAPASAFTLRDAAGAGAGNVVARGTGTPTIGTPEGVGATANSQVTFDFEPVAVAPATEAPATLPEGTYWFHGTNGIRDASDDELRHNPRGSDAGVQLSTSVAPTFDAWFLSPLTIELSPSETLARETVVAAGSIVITAPDDTNQPADADSLPDTIALASATPVDYVAGSVITVTLQSAAALGVTYTVAPAATITDSSGVEYGGATLDVSYGLPFAAEARSRTETVVTFDGGVLSGTLNALPWRIVEGDVAQPGSHRLVHSVATLDSSGSAVPGETSTITIGDDRFVTETTASIAASSGRTSLVITHAPLDRTDATPSVTYAGGGLREGAAPIVALVPVTATDGISPEVVSYRLPRPADGGINAHLIVVFSENMDHPRSHAIFPLLYAAPTGGSHAFDIIGSSFQSLGRDDCNTCVMTIEYTAEPPEGTYYLAVSSLTDANGNAYDKTASRQVGEEGRIRIEYDQTAPVLGVSAFTSTRTIAIAFDDILSTSPALTAANFAVTVPDDTNQPADADTDPDTVALDATTPVTYDTETRTVTLHLAANAVRDVIHTITPSSFNNAAGIAYAGGQARAAYVPIFSATAVDGQTTLVEFFGGIADVFNAGDWTVTDHNAAQPTNRPVTGISGEASPDSQTLELFNERRVEITHEPIGPGDGRLVIEYTVPAGGLSVGGLPLLAGTVWEVDATYGQPFVAETRSQTETVLTFDAGVLSGSLITTSWQVAEGATTRDVTSIAALDPSGNPVAAATATPNPPDFLGAPVSILQHEGYTKLLITHDPLSSTGATPTVTQTSPSVSEGGLYVFQNVPVEAADRAPPEVVSYRRGTDADSVGLTAHIVVVFSENMAFPLYRISTDLYSGPTGDNRVRDSVERAIGNFGRDDCNTCSLGVQFNAAVPDGLYYLAATTVVDLAGNAVDPASSTVIGEESRLRISLDRTAPILESAEFTGTKMIAVRFDDGLDTTPPLAAANFAVTAPDDTNLPADSDTDPDVIPLGGLEDVTYDLPTRTATLHLAANAVPGVEYTVTPTGISNEAGLAFAGGSTRATYTPLFTAVSLDGDTTLVTFRGDVTATLAAQAWAVTQHVPTREGITSTPRDVTGISAQGGAAASTLALNAGRTVAITHAGLVDGPPPVISYATPDGGLDVGSTSLPARAVWHAQATYAEPFAAETRSLTETVVTFDGGALSGTLTALPWRIVEGDVAQPGSHRLVHSVATLDSSGSAVPGETSTITIGEDRSVSETTASIAASSGRTSLLITHAPLDSTDATPSVTYRSAGGDLRENSLVIFSNVPVTSADRISPEISHVRRGVASDAGLGLGVGHVVVVFTERMVDPDYSKFVDLHSTAETANTFRNQDWVYETVGYAYVTRALHDACAGCALSINYEARPADGIYYMRSSDFHDANGNQFDTSVSRIHAQYTSSRIVLDSTAPVLESAEFTSATTIAVKFDDGLDNSPPLTENNFAVSTPDGLVGFHAATQVTYDLDTLTATLYLREDATPGVTYTVTPSSINNEVGLAFAGGSTTAMYVPTFTATALDADTTLVTFTGDVTATINMAEWTVTDNTGQSPVPRTVTGISAQGGTAAPTLALSAGRTVEISHDALGRDELGILNRGSTITYTVPAGGLDVGSDSLAAGTTWVAEATFADAFAAETRSRTETVVTFDGGAISGFVDASNWILAEDGAARAISTVAPLDSSGNPVAADTSAVGNPAHPDPPVEIEASDGYTRLLITHERLDSTAATPAVTHNGGLRENSLHVFRAPVTSADRISPEISHVRRGVASDAGIGLGVYHVVLVFTERMVDPDYAKFVDLHRTAETANTFRNQDWVYENVGYAYVTRALHDACAGCALALDYEARPADGIYFMRSSDFHDANGNQFDTSVSRIHAQYTSSRIVFDTTAPVLVSAEFVGAKSIAVRFDDGLSTSPPLTAANFAVTSPGAVALDATSPVSYDLPSLTATVRLAEPATVGTTYTVTPSSVNNEVGIAFAGGSTSAMYMPRFTAETTDGDTTLVTFTGDVTATLAAADWTVTDNTGSTPTDRAVSGISAQGGTAAATLALSAGRTVEISHAALGAGAQPPTIAYTVPAGGITVGTEALAAGTTWVADATYGDPFVAETRSRTETVVTFDGGNIDGTLDTGNWQVREGESLRPIVSIAALDSSGEPVAAATAVPYSGSGPIQTIAVAASDGYTSLLFTHASLDSTASTPTLTHVTGPDLTEGSLHIFPRVPVTSADRMAPELESVRHAAVREYYPYNRPYVVFNFSEDMALLGSIYPHLYRAQTGGAPTHSMVSAYHDAAGRDCNTCSVAVGYTSRVADGAYYAALATLTDINGNYYDAASSRTPGQENRVRIAIDPTAPVINVAEFSSTQAIRLDFDDALDTSFPLSAANFAVTAPDDTNAPGDPGADPDVIALDATAPVTYDSATSTVTLRLGAPAVAGTPYSVTPTSIRNEAGLPYARGEEQVTYTPLFTTRLLGQTATLVTFRAPVSGAFATGDWTVRDTDASMTMRAVSGISDRDDAPSATHTLRNAQELVLTHASLATGESMPLVSYTVPGTTVLAGGVPLPAGGVWTTTAYSASSSPSLTTPSVQFSTPSLIAVRFGEPVELLDVGAWRVNGANMQVDEGSAREILIRLSSPAREGVPHTIEIDRGAVRGLQPPHLQLSHSIAVSGVTYYDPTTFQARTERVGSDEYVRVEFNGRAAGTTVPGEWLMTHAPQFDPTPPQQLYTLCGGTLAPTTSIDVSDICGDGSSNSIYLPEPPLRGSGSIAFVTYRTLTASASTPITVNGQTVGDMPVRSTDGLPPEISQARTLDANRVLVRFDEQVTGTPEASHWYHYASAATSTVPPTAAELAAASTSFDRAELIEEGLAMILTLPDSYSPSTGWGSTDTAAVPGAIGLRVPGGASAGLTDNFGNQMASGTARGPVTDGAPPGLMTLTARVFTDDDSDPATPQVAKTGAHAHVAHAGDEVEVSATFTEALSTSPGPTVQVFGTVLTTSPAGAESKATSGRIAVPDTWASDGLLDYAVSVNDAQGNAAAYSRHSVAALPDPIRTDVSAPGLVTVFPVSPMRLMFTFSEEITGSGMVTAASGATVADSDPTAPLTFAAGSAGTQATADFALTQGDYTFHFASTLVDLGGREIPPGQAFVPGPPAPAEELMTDRYIPAPPPPPDRMAERPFDRMIMAPPPPPDVAPGASPNPFRLLADALVDDDEATPELESRPFGSTLQIGYERTALRIPEGTVIRDLGGNDPDETPGTLLMELARRAADTTYVGMPEPSAAQRDANERAAQSIQESPPEILVTFGKRDDMLPVLFDQPVRITLLGAAGAEHVFYTASSQPNPDAPPSRLVSTIPRCEDLGYGGTLEDPPSFPAPTPPVRVGETVRQPASGLLECYLLQGEHIVIWTNHFTQFGASNISRGGSGGDGCDDCTPPTLGVDSTGTRRVSGGFTYNGDTVNAEYYYTPLPLITVETGEENTAILKVFEDTGTHNMRHVGLSFGLSNGQHFAEAEAAIRVDIAFNGEHTVSLHDPQNAIDADSLSAEVGTAQCMAGSETECSLVTIRHTFREPLEFNVVSTIVWDDRRNSWQNFFNHGVHVTGESLNPSHGIEVNGGELVLFPLIAGHTDEDGDGTYDYDERHVTYMLDAEYRVYRLTPDGTYQPVRNLSSLHHEIDESMWDESLPKKYGPSRASELFAELVAEERRIAEELLAEMDIPTEGNATAVVSHSYDRAAVEKRAEELRMAIADEINAAELSMQRLYPEMYVVE